VKWRGYTTIIAGLSGRDIGFGERKGNGYDSENLSSEPEYLVDFVKTIKTVSQKYEVNDIIQETLPVDCLHRRIVGGSKTAQRTMPIENGYVWN
jgi:hypothetical protein